MELGEMTVDLVIKPRVQLGWVTPVLATVALVLALLAPWKLEYLAVRTLFSSRGLVHVADTNAKYWEAQNLIGTLAARGYPVAFESDLMTPEGKAYGITFAEPRHIVVEESLKWDARFAVLAHEGGHVLSPSMTSVEEECFAEGVAYLVARDGAREHARYMARSRWVCAVTLTAYSSEIESAATLLEAR